MKDLDNTIAAKQAGIDSLTIELQDRMAAADALLSSMQQQYSFLSSLFQAQQDASKQY